jgi:hypothetical protein
MKHNDYYDISLDVYLQFEGIGLVKRTRGLNHIGG